MEVERLIGGDLRIHEGNVKIWDGNDEGFLSKKIKPIKPIKEKVLSCFNSIARPRNIAVRIKEINENLDAINKVANDLGLVQRLTDVPSLLDASFETDSFTLDPIFIGRDDLVLEIVEKLTTAISTDECEIPILAIVGMGGLGKTTLTRKVFNHPRMKTLFGSLIWVHVSQNFDPITLFKKILKELSPPHQVEVESRQDILKKLQEALKDKTYLLILDDVWNQDSQIWDAFMNSLLGVTSLKGNAIVVTTRNVEVASTVNPLHTHQLKGLTDEECWSIIKTKSSGNEEVPSELEKIGRNIARRCQGLPLAANVVGGVMHDQSEGKWLSIEQKWLSDDEGGNITKILRLSFDNLSPPSLKKCFAYCSIIPKGKEIWKQEMIECWMAEGFLLVDGSNDTESMGDKFMNVLLHNSLLQVSERDDYGNVKSCVMHDLVHDLACSVLGSYDNADGISRVRYMTLQDQSSPIPKQAAKYLRTLFLKGDISATIFSDLESLHVLTLPSSDVRELPSSIRNLIHLRKLDISDTMIINLPVWIGELHHLQTLSASGLYVKKLPSMLKYLINLRHLYIDYDVELPAEIGRLTSLQTLEHFTVGDKKGWKVEELGSLNNLKGEVNIYNLERVHNKEEAEKANLFKKSKVHYLSLQWKENREGETNDENVLEGLVPPSGLKKLAIVGFNGKRFPWWTLKMAVRDGPQGSLVGLKKLMSVSLLECSECEEIPMLGQLPNLKSLKLKGLSNLKSINSSFYGSVNQETLDIFPALERLELFDMPKLAEWAEAEFSGASEVKVFPQVQHLEIVDCQQLMSAPTHFPSLEHLKIKRIGSYKPLANIFETKLRLLKEVCLEEIDEVEFLPDWLFYNNPNLSTLEIRKCPKLRELPDGLCSLNSLEKLIIGDCPNLEWIAHSGVEQSLGSSLTSLRYLEVLRCDALVYLPCEMVGSSLEKLSLVGLNSLKNLPSLIDCLPKLPCLTYWLISGFPDFMATYRHLGMLGIDVRMGGTMETVDGILMLGCCHSLTNLRLQVKESWESVPESIQHLTALQVLTLENFGMEELPEWFGNLSSLRTLELVDCKKLRRLSSTDAMRRLAELNFLGIRDCPELAIQKSDADSEWPKISHIPSIYIHNSAGW